MNLIFDIETDGLYDDVTKIHCLGIHDIDANQTMVFNDEGSEQPITRGLQYLEDAQTIIGHNVIGFDIPVIRKLYGWFSPLATVVDTLILSRIYHADILSVDQKRKWRMMTPQLYGRHSLEAWGYRLNEYKGVFAKTTDWKDWSQEMQDYMLQDVQVTEKLWQHFVPYLNGSRWSTK